MESPVDSPHNALHVMEIWSVDKKQVYHAISHAEVYPHVWSLENEQGQSALALCPMLDGGHQRRMKGA